MTGDDHNTDALIAALRSPALPAERAGEAAAVTAMLEVLGTVPAPSHPRVRRGIAIAVVTVASLGVGGLAAAGPGVFSAAADRARSLVSADTDPESGDDGTATDGDSVSDSSTGGNTDKTLGGALAAQAAAAAGDAAAAIECAEGNHGATVSSIAQGTVPDGENHGEAVSPAAQSDCGKPNAGDESSDGSDGTPDECADGNHGATASDAAHTSVPPDGENRGQTVSGAAQSDCGDKQVGAQGSPPASTPNGPPVSTPNGPPVSTPHGPPVSTPNGPPVSTPNGPPVSTPNGPPVSTPNGPPVSTPSGPPVSTPSGPPVSTPNGPPAAPPQGPPVTPPGKGNGNTDG